MNDYIKAALLVLFNQLVGSLFLMKYYLDKVTEYGFSLNNMEDANFMAEYNRLSVLTLNQLEFMKLNREFFVILLIVYLSKLFVEKQYRKVNYKA